MRDERGGAVSLWVILMVPVAAFAAVAAMAGPQRLAARAGMQDAADDLATFAVAWRDGKQDPDGELPTFPLSCESDDGDGPGGRARSAALADAVQQAQDALDAQTNLGHSDGHTDYDQAAEALKQAEARRDDSNESPPGEWRSACELVTNALVGDLGRLGVASHSMSGAYSDSLSTAPSAEPDWPQGWPCRRPGGMVVNDAVHASLAGDWQDAGWAASQVWPDGFRVAGESTAALARRFATQPAEPCKPPSARSDPLSALDTQGRPVWLDDPEHDARRLAHSVSHTPLSE